MCSKKEKNNLVNVPEYKRIVTHTDFDGTISALFLREMFDIEDIRFTEPWLIQSGDFWIKKGDIIVDLPYNEKASLWIDHHKSTEEFALKNPSEKKIHDSTKKSCPPIIYERFHKEFPVLEEYKYLIEPCNKIDSAEFTKEDLENPDVYGLLSMSLRSDDKKKDDEFKRFLINMLSFTKADKVLEQPMIKNRINNRLKEIDEWKTKIKDFVKEYKQEKVLVIDTSEEELPRGQKFWLYLMYPGNSHSIMIDSIKNDSETLKISVGKNIFEDFPERKIDVSELMKAYGGGGHKDVGGCGIPKNKKEEIIKDLIKKISFN